MGYASSIDSIIEFKSVSPIHVYVPGSPNRFCPYKPVLGKSEIITKTVIQKEKNVNDADINEFKGTSYSLIMDMYGDPNILVSLLKTLLENRDHVIEDVVFSIVGEETLRDLLKELTQRKEVYHEKVYYRISLHFVP